MHFSDDSFEISTLMYQLIPETNFKRVFKPKSLPNINSPKSIENEKSPRTLRAEQKEKSGILSHLLESPIVPPVSRHKVKDLKKQLKDYGLLVTGNKIDLVNRLEMTKEDSIKKKVSIEILNFVEETQESKSAVINVSTEE
ncbi:unnamed protein product [Lepeophtheirus salmonis]|uniref:(salmon louse) hypothetical protein n=1 Tax=Lepeophtheirus salmonis TaxID=72036 RepID=A0A7R8CLK5_LEPSM|nr:unnamed protein product [Lepeophtheirus salmonis]CAF2829107.1 unnamed protein product [Lepeophtheirus salmonis]